MKATWLTGAEAGQAIAPDVLRDQGIPNEHATPRGDAYQGLLDRYMGERGYVTQDQVALEPTTPNLGAICDKFKDEHLHDDDEVRFVLEGEGVFDIRSLDDRWMRIEVFPGDLIVVPSGRFHRFFLTDRKHIRCVRLFKDANGWSPKYREGAPDRAA